MISPECGDSGSSESLVGRGPLPNSLMGYQQAQLLSLELLYVVVGDYTRIGTIEMLRGTKTEATVPVTHS